MKPISPYIVDNNVRTLLIVYNQIESMVLSQLNALREKANLSPAEIKKLREFQGYINQINQSRNALDPGLVALLTAAPTARH